MREVLPTRKVEVKPVAAKFLPVGMKRLSVLKLPIEAKEEVIVTLVRGEVMLTVGNPEALMSDTTTEL